MQHYVTYTPQQNNVTERKNRPLKAMVAYLLEARDLPPYIWEEIVNCSSYIHNRVTPQVSGWGNSIRSTDGT